MLRQLHWLPVRQRVVFKVATLVYQSLCGYAPGYLVDDCQLVTDVRATKLRSADTRTLADNRTCSSFGDRTFAAAATRVWNSLPPDMRKPELSYDQFRRSLEDIFIRTVRPRRIVNCLIAPPRNILTYLLTYLLTYVLTCRLV